MNPAAKVASVLGAGALSIALIAKWEGLELTGYADRLAGDIPTACYGHTATAQVGRRYTVEECMRLLAVDAVEHGVRISHCITVDVPPESMAAFISFAYNVGVSAFCGSTLARRLNAGDLAGACSELDRWVFAGGQRVRGLENRRRAEREFCERGLKGLA